MIVYGRKLWTGKQELLMSLFFCHGESTKNSRFVDTNVRGPKARVHLYYKSTVPSAFCDLEYCLLV